jgi:hypothetical protein
MAVGLVKAGRDALARSAGFNCMFPNVEIMPGLSPYARNPAEADAILARLAGLLDDARHERVAVGGLGDIAELFISALMPQSA